MHDCKRYIISGTPGAGKTTMLRYLERLGHPVIEEAASDVIALDQALGIAQLWRKPDFIHKVHNLQQQRQAHCLAMRDELLFVDRSFICSYALCMLLKQQPPQQLMDAIHDMIKRQVYQQKVLFIENLGFITATNIRQISLEDALDFEKLHLEAYETFGFTCVIIPKMSIEKRLQRIKAIIKHDP